jgi:hypothetical protein
MTNSSKLLENFSLTLGNLKTYEDNLMRTERRRYFFSAFSKELENSLGPNVKFDARNDIIWNLLRDSMNMLIIDTVSISRYCYKKGGLISQLANVCPFLKVLPNKSHPNYIDISAQLSENSDYLALRERAFSDLFPNALSRSVNQNDITSLKEKFSNDLHLKKLRNIRDNFSAHRYDEIKIESVSVTIEEIRFVQENIEKLLNHIRVTLTAYSPISYSDMNSASPEETSKDLVDILILGNLKKRAAWFGYSKMTFRDSKQYPYLLRDPYYEGLKSRYQTKNDEEIPINHHSIIDPENID